MSTIRIPYKVSNELITSLINNNMRLTDYGPAYNGESVALDLFNTGPTVSIPPSAEKFDHEIWSGLEERVRKSIFKILIPSGLYLALPKGYVALLRERGSITKTPLVLRAGVIDPGYTGEIFVNLINTSSLFYEIPQHAKLPVQLLVLPIVNDFKYVTDSAFNDLVADSKRSSGCIGSSD